ncbi:hypothetical protein ACLBYD_29980 [Rhodococcus sp. C26F]
MPAGNLVAHIQLDGASIDISINETFTKNDVASDVFGVIRLIGNDFVQNKG